jgi:hypothetical protein
VHDAASLSFGFVVNIRSINNCAPGKSMRPFLFTFGASGFPFLRGVGRFAEAIGKCQGRHLRIYKIMEGRTGAGYIGYRAAGAKRMKNIPDI